ncbi:AVT4 [Candida pseudojiufengensis]|uniref:AVT4 n=1 Tax=Candida pseudojiufengensis TaxID=497109 RepID=UPI002224A755|nr:AVT4 [Candida pseudojiufengensis]KAI5963666.1 AVT4 [Candida pseudojiufengensis]
MTKPKDIKTNQPIPNSKETNERRRSIALLTRSPISSSPYTNNNQNSSSPRGSQNNSYVSNTQFLRENTPIPQLKTNYMGNNNDNESALIETSNSSNDNIGKKPTTKTIQEFDKVDLSEGINDPKIISKISKHLSKDSDSNLKNEGGDITRDLYKIQQDLEIKPKLKRSKSFNGEGDDDSDNSSIKSRASSFNVPGGFRREFLIQQHQQQKNNQQQHQQQVHALHQDNESNYEYQQPYNHNKLTSGEDIENGPIYRPISPNFVTRNFIEFLSIYGHFAGEDLEDPEEETEISEFQKQHQQKKLFYPQHSEDTPLLLRSSDNYNPKGTATDKKAYFLLLKAFVGTGVLFLPKAFANGGLIFSISLLIFFAILSWWCYLILVITKNKTKVSGFAEIGLKLYGPWLQKLILFSIVISQIGFVAAYIVFTSENLRAFVLNVLNLLDITDLNDLEFEFPIYWFILLQVIIVIPISLIRDITKLSISAVLANLFIMMGLVIIMYFINYEFIIMDNFKFGPNIEFFFNKEDFSLFIGTAIFAFEGIGLIIPIQESMIYPQNFPKVLYKVMITITLMFIIIGTLGYLTFGSHIKTVILLNLPQDSILIIMTQFFYSLAILLSTPLQLFPAIRLIESKLFSLNSSGKISKKVKWFKNLFRTLFVCLTAFIAFLGGKNLDKFVYVNFTTN